MLDTETAWHNVWDAQRITFRNNELQLIRPKKVLKQAGVAELILIRLLIGVLINDNLKGGFAWIFIHFFHLSWISYYLICPPGEAPHYQ
jgi:hypothetical protein